MKYLRLIFLLALPFLSQAQPTEFSGIGVVISPRVSYSCYGSFEIIDVVKGGPADKAGIKPFTCIYAVDGMDIADLELDFVTDLIRGPVGTPVTLTIGYDRTRQVDIIRQSITPEMVANTPQRTPEEDQLLKSKRYEAEMALERQRYNEHFFDLIELAVEAAKDQFETFLEHVDYRPTEEQYHGATGSMRRYPVLTKFLDQLGLYDMNQEMSLYFWAQQPYFFAGDFYPFRKGYNILTRDDYFDQMHADFKKLIKERFTSKGWVLKEYMVNPDKHNRTSFFIHRPGDDKEFHKYPQIRIEFKGSTQAELKIEAPYSEADKKLMKGRVDPRRNRGTFDTDRFNQICKCLSGDCVNGPSTVKCDAIGWRQGTGHFSVWDFTYTGEMMDGMAHGKGKVETVAHTQEGVFWRGEYDGVILFTNKDTRELVEYTYDKGKHIKTRSITQEAQQAALRKQWDEILKQHKSSGGGSGSSSSGRYVNSPASRFVVPAGLPMQLEEIADGFVEVQRGKGYRLVQRYSSKMSSTHTFYTTKYGYRVDIVAITGGNLGKAELEVRNIAAKQYKSAHYKEYFGSQSYRSGAAGDAYYKAFNILDDAPGGERAELRASTWNYTDGYVILMVFEKREL